MFAKYKTLDELYEAPVNKCQANKCTIQPLWESLDFNQRIFVAMEIYHGTKSFIDNISEKSWFYKFTPYILKESKDAVFKSRSEEKTTFITKLITNNLKAHILCTLANYESELRELELQAGQQETNVYGSKYSKIITKNILTSYTSVNALYAAPISKCRTNDCSINKLWGSLDLYGRSILATTVYQGTKSFLCEVSATSRFSKFSPHIIKESENAFTTLQKGNKTAFIKCLISNKLKAHILKMLSIHEVQLNQRDFDLTRQKIIDTAQQEINQINGYLQQQEVIKTKNERYRSTEGE